MKYRIKEFFFLIRYPPCGVIAQGCSYSCFPLERHFSDFRLELLFQKELNFLVRNREFKSTRYNLQEKSLFIDIF